MDLDLADDWRWVSNRDTLTYYVKNSHGHFPDAFDDPVTVPNCKRRAVTKKDIADDEMLTSKDSVWHIWRSQLDAGLGDTGHDVITGMIVPKQGDVVIDGLGNKFILQTIEIQSLGQRYRCTSMVFVETEVSTE